MKLYIPTCTLNFNNIFSTESISPAAFYAERDFGNKRFEKVEANNSDNLLVFYSRFPYFDIEDKGLDNYPMVIEIETEALPHQPHKIDNIKGVDVYVSASTIYLNPFNTILYFNDYQALTVVRLRAEQSIENKLFNLYRNNCRIRKTETKSFLKSLNPFNGNNEETFTWNNSYTQKVTDENHSKQQEIAKDKRIDRVKGFVYCYLIGANLSSSEEISQLKAIARKIKNKLSAIVYSPDRKPTPAQDDALLADTKEFNRIFALTSEVSKQNLAKTEHCIKYSGVLEDYPDLKVEDIFRILERLFIKNDFISKCGGQKVYDAFDVYECLESPAERIVEHSDRVIRVLFNEVMKLESQLKLSKVNYQIEKLLDISADGIKSIIDTTFRQDFYQTFANDLIQDKYQQAMSEQNLRKDTAIALLGGSILKEYLKDKWENSPTQRYVNELLAHLQAGASFDLHATDNLVLISYAAFVQKGADIDRLKDYLVQQGVSDYRLAYGLYGATEGFASLPKTLTYTLFDSNDTSYLCDVYKAMYQSFTGIKIKENSLPAATPTEQAKKEAKIEQKTEVKKESAKQEMQVQRNISPNSSSIIDELKENVPEFRTLDPKAIVHYTQEIDKLYSGKVDKTFIQALSKIDIFPKTKGKWEKVMAYLKKKQKADIQQPKRLFSDSGLSFIEDNNASLLMENMDFIDKEIRKKIIASLKSIQSGYCPGKYYDVRRDPKDNKNVIDHFVRYCFSDKNEYSKIPATRENQELLKKIQKLLNSRYK